MFLQFIIERKNKTLTNHFESMIYIKQAWDSRQYPLAND